MILPVYTFLGMIQQERRLLFFWNYKKYLHGYLEEKATQQLYDQPKGAELWAMKTKYQVVKIKGVIFGPSLVERVQEFIFYCFPFHKYAFIWAIYFLDFEFNM